MRKPKSYNRVGITNFFNVMSNQIKKNDRRQEKVRKESQLVLGKEMREMLDSELKAIDGGKCQCHLNSSCKRRT